MYFEYDPRKKALRPMGGRFGFVNTDEALEFFLTADWKAVARELLQEGEALKTVAEMRREADGRALAEVLALLSGRIPSLSSAPSEGFASSLLLSDEADALFAFALEGNCFAADYFEKRLGEVSALATAVAADVRRLNRHPELARHLSGFASQDCPVAVNAQGFGSLMLLEDVVGCLLADDGFTAYVCENGYDPLGVGDIVKLAETTLTLIDGAREAIHRADAETFGMAADVAESLAMVAEWYLSEGGDTFPQGAFGAHAPEALLALHGSLCAEYERILVEGDGVGSDVDGAEPWDSFVAIGGDVLSPYELELAWTGRGFWESLDADTAGALVRRRSELPAVYRADTLPALLSLLLSLVMEVEKRRLAVCEVCGKPFVAKCPTHRYCNRPAPGCPDGGGLTCSQKVRLSKKDYATAEARSRSRMNSNLTRRIKTRKTAAERGDVEDVDLYRFLLVSRAYLRTMEQRYREQGMTVEDIRPWWDSMASLGAGDVVAILAEADRYAAKSEAERRRKRPPRLFEEVDAVTKAIVPAPFDWGRYDRRLWEDGSILDLLEGLTKAELREAKKEYRKATALEGERGKSRKADMPTS